MPIKSTYVIGHSSEFGEFRQSVPVHLENGGFFLCTAGSGDVVVASKQYHVEQWDLIVGLPHSYAHAIHTSEDFDGVIFGVDLATLLNAELGNRSFYITAVSENSSISLSESEALRLLRLTEAFSVESKKTDHPLRNEIDRATLQIIIYEVAALFHNREANIEQKRTRDDIIFNNFIVQLYSEEPYYRNLDHFVEGQSITVSHLSKVVKRVSGRTVSQWVSNYTIISIKRMLQDKDTPIGAIAERLNFPNASFLAQYFKKHTSQTPREYRAEFFQT